MDFFLVWAALQFTTEDSTTFCSSSSSSLPIQQLPQIFISYFLFGDEKEVSPLDEHAKRLTEVNRSFCVSPLPFTLTGLLYHMFLSPRHMRMCLHLSCSVKLAKLNLKLHEGIVGRDERKNEPEREREREREKWYSRTGWDRMPAQPEASEVPISSSECSRNKMSTLVCMIVEGKNLVPFSSMSVPLILQQSALFLAPTR